MTIDQGLKARAIEFLAVKYEAAGDKAAAFTLRNVGAVGDVLAVAVRAIEAALSSDESKRCFYDAVRDVASEGQWTSVRIWPDGDWDVSKPDAARTPSPSLYRCVNCKRVLERAKEPDLCPDCLGRTFAKIDASPSPSLPSREAVALVERLRALLEKSEGRFPTRPWRVVPSDGKPLIRGGDNAGNLFAGFIATWDQAELAVAAVNALPELLSLLPVNGWMEGVEAAAKVAESKYSYDRRASHYRIAGRAIAKAIRALSAAPGEGAGG